MRRTLVAIQPIVLLAIALIFCSAVGDQYAWGRQMSAQIPQEATPLVELALADAAERLGVDPSSLSVSLVEPRTWSDTSLGCPQPDRAYLQVITPGYLIVLQGEGQTYNYHTDYQRVVLCERDERRETRDERRELRGESPETRD